MCSLSKLFYLLWSPWLIAASLTVVVQTDPNRALQPGETLKCTVIADLLPAATLGITLVTVQGANSNGPRAILTSSMTMRLSPTTETMYVPSDIAQGFYTVDVHANTSASSRLLASSNVIQIAFPASILHISQEVTQSTAQAAFHKTASVSAMSVTTHATAASATATAIRDSSQSAASAASQRPINAVRSAISGVLGCIVVILLLLLLWRYRAARNQHHSINDVERLPSAPRFSDHLNGFNADPFRNVFREFTPNRRTSQVPSLVTPFVIGERSKEPGSPESLYAGKYCAFGSGGSASAHDPRHCSLVSTDSSDASGAPSEQLRNARHKIPGEISIVKSPGGQPCQFVASSAGSPSPRDDDDSLEMRNRLDMLTQQVQQLEIIIRDAPPIYRPA